MLYNKLNKPIIEFIGKVKHTFLGNFCQNLGEMLLFAIGKQPLFTFCNWKTACKSLEAVILGEKKQCYTRNLRNGRQSQTLWDRYLKNM